MSAEQHTPGPWTIDGNHFQIWANDGGNAVASVYSTTAPEPMASEARANARLIAAAPDLLAFAERVASWQGNKEGMSGCVWSELIRQASEAIARATGAEGEGAK